MEDILSLIHMIEHPNQAPAWIMYCRNIERFVHARGSSYNHQAFDGGYLEHVKQVMNIAIELYTPLSNLSALPFTLHEALLVLWLHDIEKPWKVDHSFANKLSRKLFREAKIVEYGFTLTKEQEAALSYVEGELDDYRPDKRVMNEMAAFCHMCDIASARIYHSVRFISKGP